MATLKHIPSNGETGSNIATLNNYIGDGHGNEQMQRTNRYINDGHGLVTEMRGYNCPTDPVLATELMQSLLQQYERNLAGRNTKGTNATKKPVTCEHIIVSFDEEDNVSPALAHQIFGEFVSRGKKLKDHPINSGDHNNTKSKHMHGVIGVVSLDGTRKIGINNKLLNEWRKELDYICYEHGLSIVKNPELCADPKYREWFKAVEAEGKITIHLPQEQEEKKRRRQERIENAKPRNAPEPPLTDDNRGTHYYTLPHFIAPESEPGATRQPMYIYAMDKDGERRAPMHLAFDLERQWCYRCLNQIDQMEFPGKEQMVKRLEDTMVDARDNIAYLEKLDICTTADLRRHLKCVGKDLADARRHIEEQRGKILEAIEQGDTVAADKARARKAKSEEREARLRLEYRNLTRIQKKYGEVMDPEQWAGYQTKLLRRSASRLTTEEQFDETVRWHFRDIGQLMSIPQEDVDRLINEAKTLPANVVLARWVEIRGNVSITYTQTSAGVSTIYQSIGDLYKERGEYRSLKRQLIYGTADAGLVGLLLLPLTIPLILGLQWEEAKLDKQIAETRQLCEEIKWHNKNSKKQLEIAQSKAAMLIAYGDAAAAADALEEFSRTCEEILDRQTDLSLREHCIPPPRPDYDLPLEDQVCYDFQSALRDYKADVRKAQAEIQRMADRKRWEETHPDQKPQQLWEKKKPGGLDAVLADAQRRSAEQARQAQQQKGVER